jgi:hypothetical protein
MRKSLLALAALACIAFNVPALAHDHDGLNMPTVAVSAFHVENMTPALPAIEAATDFNTTAMYALNDVVVTMPSKMVFRDFRTIADSGGPQG